MHRFLRQWLRFTRRVIWVVAAVPVTWLLHLLFEDWTLNVVKDFGKDHKVIETYVLPALSFAVHYPVRTSFIVAMAVVALCAVFAATRDAGQPTTAPAAAGTNLGQRLAAQQYSSQQTIQISSVPGNYNETLNLDNVAALVQSGEASRDAVQMVLPATPPLTVAQPKAGEQYRVGGGAVSGVPSAGTPGIDIRSARTFDASSEFIFDRARNSVHVVQVGRRRFRVALNEINDESTSAQMLMEYVFGISEE